MNKARTVSVGDRFLCIVKQDPEDLSREYLLAQTDTYSVHLVNLQNGNRWTDPALVLPDAVRPSKIPWKIFKAHFATGGILQEWRKIPHA